VRELRRRDLLLVALTFAAGSVDAVALLRLDVFTAVMTGNIVLLGLAVGHGAFGNVLRSIVALVAYGVGVVAGARIVGAVALSTVPAFAPAIPLAAVGGVVVAATRFR